MGTAGGGRGKSVRQNSVLGTESWDVCQGVGKGPETRGDS